MKVSSMKIKPSRLASAVAALLLLLFFVGVIDIGPKTSLVLFILMCLYMAVFRKQTARHHAAFYRRRYRRLFRGRPRYRRLYRQLYWRFEYQRGTLVQLETAYLLFGLFGAVFASVLLVISLVNS